MPPIACRIGGFGGAEGLARFLREAGVERLIDATHPFAARISRNASLAASLAGVPLLAIRRPPWLAVPGDRWTLVADMPAAAKALGEVPRRVFLAVGRQELGPFRACRHRYVIRSVEAPEPSELPEHATVVTARGPFSLAAERALLRHHGIECLVTKNSGGVTGNKLTAARELGLEVVMVARPEKPAVLSVPDHLGALAWLHDTERGV